MVHTRNPAAGEAVVGTHQAAGTGKLGQADTDPHGPQVGTRSLTRDAQMGKPSRAHGFSYGPQEQEL